MDVVVRSGRRKSRVLDLCAGFLAICIVLAAAISIRNVGSDLRALCVLTASAFFFAGLARGRSVVHNTWMHALLVSCPGFLGTAALIMNDGFHRLLIPIALAMIAILLTALGIQARRLWPASRNKSWLVCLGSAVAICLATFVLVPSLSAYASVEEINRPAPPFTLTTFDGTSVKSSDLRGHVTVLAFWATWCMACHWELPELEPIYKHFQHNPEVIFWAVDADWGGEGLAKGRNFFELKNMGLPGAFDSGGAGRALGVDALPMILILDRQGQLRMAHHGYDASEHIAALVSARIEYLLTPR